MAMIRRVEWGHRFESHPSRRVGCHIGPIPEAVGSGAGTETKVELLDGVTLKEGEAECRCNAKSAVDCSVW